MDAVAIECVGVTKTFRTGVRDVRALRGVDLTVPGGAVPAGLWLNNMLLRGVGEAIGYGPEIGSPPALLTAAVTIGAVGVAAVGIGALTCVRSARASATELLRYE